MTYKEYAKKKHPNIGMCCPGTVVKGGPNYNEVRCSGISCAFCENQVIPNYAVDAFTGKPVYDGAEDNVALQNALLAIKDICRRSNCINCVAGGACRPLFAVKPSDWPLKEADDA